MSNMGALSERNERVKYARSIGVVKPHTLKKAELEAAIYEAEQIIDAPDFTPSDLPATPSIIEEDVINTVGDAIATRDATREAWLMDAVSELKTFYRDRGRTEVDKYPCVISVGFPHGNVRKVIGQCHHAEQQGGTAHIFINPTQDNGFKVLGIVSHELCHLPGYSGHTGEFKKMAICGGLKGVGGKNGTGFTATVISDEDKDAYEAILAKLGPYPHTAINLADMKTKTQTTRMLKASCQGITDDEEYWSPCGLMGDDDRPYTIRLSKKWAEAGLPTCPCGGEMKLEEKDGE